MTHAEAGSNPPCGTCDKIPVGRPHHWDHAIEFDPWFHDIVRWYRESEAVRDFGTPNDTLRLLAGVVRAFDLKTERAASSDVVKAIIDFMGK